MGEDSTMVPILFTGDTLLMCSVGSVDDPASMYKSL